MPFNRTQTGSTAAQRRQREQTRRIKREELEMQLRNKSDISSGQNRTQLRAQHIKNAGDMGVARLGATVDRQRIGAQERIATAGNLSAERMNQLRADTDLSTTSMRNLTSQLNNRADNQTRIGISNDKIAHENRQNINQMGFEYMKAGGSGADAQVGFFNQNQRSPDTGRIGSVVPYGQTPRIRSNDIDGDYIFDPRSKGVEKVEFGSGIGGGNGAEAPPLDLGLFENFDPSRPTPEQKDHLAMMQHYYPEQYAKLRAAHQQQSTRIAQ